MRKLLLAIILTAALASGQTHSDFRPTSFGPQAESTRMNGISHWFTDLKPWYRDPRTNRIDKPYSVMMGLLLAADSGDYATTRISLSRGAFETNPALRPLAEREPLGIAGVVFLHSFLNHGSRILRQDGSGRGSRMVAYAFTGACAAVSGWATWHNIQVMHTLRQR